MSQGTHFFSDFKPNMLAFFKHIPIIFWPFYFLYALPIAAAVYAYYVLCHVTCKIEIVGYDPRDQGPLIRSHWHRYFSIAMIAHLFLRNEVWMIHPLAYMIPWYFTAKLLGIHRLIPGSSGHDGKKAAEEIIQLLRDGFNTHLLPDGPDGPPYVIKKGVFMIAEKSGAKIQPISFEYRRCLTIPTWDKKIIPIPFISSIKLFYGNLISFGDSADLEAKLKESLGD